MGVGCGRPRRAVRVAGRSVQSRANNRPFTAAKLHRAVSAAHRRSPVRRVSLTACARESRSARCDRERSISPRSR